MVTFGTCGSQLSCRSSCGSSNGRVEAYTTWPWMPPFSPAAKAFLTNSMNEFWPEKPCDPSLSTQAGSMRPVEPFPTAGSNPRSLARQSADAQYRAPGTRSARGTETCSAVFAMFPAMLDFPHGAVGGFAELPQDVPSAGPPAS